MAKNLAQWNKQKSGRVNFYEFIESQLAFDAKGRCINAFKVLSDAQTLKLSYESTKSKPGNMTKGVDKETLDGINKVWFEETAEALRNESWKPKPVRRIYIPKPNGKMRPIGISSPREKIIQQSMKMALETVLDKSFEDCSHGFRPNKGCHTALRQIREWKGVSWFIEGDIVGFFTNMDHNVLDGLLRKHFDEARLINLFWKFAKAGYIEWESKEFVPTEAGYPQGSVLSPVLSNLMLHSIDRYMKSVIRKFEEKCKGIKPYLTNPEYHKFTMRINRLKKKILLRKQKGLDNSIEKLSLISSIKARRKMKSLIPNPNFVKIAYQRYADDWIVGIWGPKKIALELKKILGDKLKALKLELSEEKTLITNARSGRAHFLGTFINRAVSDRWVSYRKVDGKARRNPSGNVWLTAPILELVKRLEDKGFLVRNGVKWNPKSIGKLTILPLPDIIRRYNSIVNGIFNYYSFADNRGKLRKIYWILSESLRKTICRKLKISESAFRKRFGKNISMTIKTNKEENKRVAFSIPDFARRPMHFLGHARFLNPFATLQLKVSTRWALDQVCASCGSSEEVEMHHVRHIKTIDVKLSNFDKQLARINRKQVPLCRTCHREVHRGNYHGKSLRHLGKWQQGAIPS
jgi:group II intron reverse transcriptase/maturase